jgi:hypothetical protein
MSRELLQRALDVIDDHMVDTGDWALADDIRAELAKPEPVECGWIEPRNGVLFNGWSLDGITDGKYRLLAERIDDES